MFSHSFWFEEDKWIPSDIMCIFIWNLLFHFAKYIFSINRKESSAVWYSWAPREFRVNQHRILSKFTYFDSILILLHLTVRWDHIFIRFGHLTPSQWRLSCDQHLSLYKCYKIYPRFRANFTTRTTMCTGTIHINRHHATVCLFRGMSSPYGSFDAKT